MTTDRQMVRDRPAPRDRVLGSLLAAACGDAIGAPFEGSPTPAIDDVAAWETDTTPLRWTDDTALLITTAEQFAGIGGSIDEEAIIRAYAAEWSADPGRGYGAGPARIFSDVLAGRDWRATTAGLFEGAGSYGNGAAMRIAPFGLVQAPLHEIAKLARANAAATHRHPLGIEGAAIQAMAVGIAAHTDPGRPIDSRSALRAVIDELALPEYRFALQRVHRLTITGAGPRETAQQLDNTTAAACSVPAALAAFLRNPDDPAAAIRFAILIGGDTDTIAAMTGALVGARCGTAGLPSGWLDRLEQSDRIRKAAAGLADRFCNRTD